MTKVDAIEKVMEDNGGTATLSDIYENITKYYPNAKRSKSWESGLRGVLYRELAHDRRFKRLGLSIYALKDYKEQSKPNKGDKVRMHSYIEGICLELGTFKNYDTYTADPSAFYRDHLQLKNFVSVTDFPKFSYDEIVDEVKRVDVVWFNKNGLAFPQKVFEVVDSVGTLEGAFNRSIQLNNFNTEFFIVAPEKHRAKYERTLHLEGYKKYSDRFRFVNYENIISLYESTSKAYDLEQKILGNKI